VVVAMVFSLLLLPSLMRLTTPRRKDADRITKTAEDEAAVARAA